MRSGVPFPALKSLTALVAHYGLGQSAEPTGTIALSRAFAIFHSRTFSEFTRKTFRSSTPSLSKMFNHRLRRKFQNSSAKHQTNLSSQPAKKTVGTASAFWSLEFIWRLEFGTWDFPAKRLPLAMPHARDELRSMPSPLTFAFLGSLSSIG